MFKISRILQQTNEILALQSNWLSDRILSAISVQLLAQGDQ